MAMTRKLWSISAAAVELGRDRRTVAGALASIPADGDIDARTKGWWLPTIISAIGGGATASDGDAPDLNAERARLTQAQADAQEMKNAHLRRELLARSDVDAAVTGAFARVRARLLAVPGKIAPSAAAMTEPAEIERATRDAIFEALNELADTSVADLCGDDGDVVGDLAPASEADGKRVGGPGAAA